MTRRSTMLRRMAWPRKRRSRGGGGSGQGVRQGTTCCWHTLIDDRGERGASHCCGTIWPSGPTAARAMSEGTRDGGPRKRAHPRRLAGAEPPNATWRGRGFASNNTVSRKCVEQARELWCCQFWHPTGLHVRPAPLCRSSPWGRLVEGSACCCASVHAGRPNQCNFGFSKYTYDLPKFLSLLTASSGFQPDQPCAFP